MQNYNIYKYNVELYIWEEGKHFKKLQYNGKNFVISLNELRLIEIPSFKQLKQQAIDYCNNLKNKTEFELKLWEHNLKTYSYDLKKSVYLYNYK